MKEEKTIKNKMTDGNTCRRLKEKDLWRNNNGEMKNKEPEAWGGGGGRKKIIGESDKVKRRECRAEQRREKKLKEDIRW